MTFPTLALICLIGLTGPLLAAATRWRVPLVVGELLAGIVFGRSGLQFLDATDPTFSLLATLGFTLTMFVAGSHVPLHDARLRPALRGGILRAAAVGVIAAGLGVVVAAVFDTGNAALYAVVMASSSAALVLPAIDELRLGGPAVLSALAQVAVADTAAIVALPIVVDPAGAPKAALGTLAIAAVAVVLYLVLRWAASTGRWRAVHRFSEKRHLALELRASLIVLLVLGSVAAAMHVSVMLAGFAAGLVVAATGEPRRLARQLFALSDGFLSPLFFVWLGASLALAPALSDPAYILLGVALGVGAVLAHMAMRLLRQPVSVGAMASAQLGVPVAAATIGAQTGALSPGEPASLLIGALITIVALSAGASRALKNPALVADRRDGRRQNHKPHRPDHAG